MKRLAIIIFLLLECGPLLAETVVPSRTIRSQSVIYYDDLAIQGGSIPGTVSDPAKIIGLEARVTLYAGRPIRLGDVGPAAMVDRNAIVPIQYVNGGLRLSAEGRALGRGAIGDRVRVMNLSSRTTVSGTIQADGSILVSGSIVP